MNRSSVLVSLSVAAAASEPVTVDEVVCQLRPDCQASADCTAETATIRVTDGRGATAEIRQVGLMGGQYLQRDQVVDGIRVGLADYEIRSTESGWAFLKPGYSGLLVAGPGDEVILTVRALPRRYQDYPGQSWTWRRECGGIF